MVVLRRITEATDSSHTSIMYNLADSLARKGYDAKYTDKGIMVNFNFNGYDPKKTKEGKQWLKDNKGKDFVFKGDGLDGSFIWDIVKNNSGNRELVTKDVRVKGDPNLLTLQKKLKPKDKVDGKLTGRSVKPFVYPDSYTITNLATPTFMSYLKRLKDQIINNVALALSEVVEQSSKKESKYFIDYDEDYNRVDEGYLTESEDKEEKTISWKDEEVQKAITDAVKGLEVNKSKTTDKELVFKYNGKNGSLHLQGYMLVLDTDTDDEIPPTNYPVKDKNNLTLDNLLFTIKTVFSRRGEALSLSENEDIKKESYVLEEDHSFYILMGDVADPSVGLDDPTWNEVIGNIKGYSNKEDAILQAKAIANKNRRKYSVYGVTKNPIDRKYFMEDIFFDAVDDGDIEIDLIDTDTKEDFVKEKRLDEVKEIIDDYVEVLPEPTLSSSPVFQDVAKERFKKLIDSSLIVAPDLEVGEGFSDACSDVVWVYLSPSYALSKLSDIEVPICLDERKISLPIVEIPDFINVFGDDKGVASVDQYEKAIQKYLVMDAPKSEIIELDLDNAEDAKATIVSFINTMAEDYQNKKSNLESFLDVEGEDLLKESRYFIVPADTDVSGEVKKINPMGYTDLNAAREAMQEIVDSGQFAFDLAILDTNFSNNKEKWNLV